MVPRAWLAACALALGGLCWGLGSYQLLEPDEGRNTEVAREMARGGDYVLPHLNGLPYLDKPATYFAAVALSLKVLGETEGAARVPSLFFTLATALLVWRLGRRMGPPGTGEIAAVAFATMPLVLVFSRTVILDSALAFLETMALGAAWRGFTDERTRRTWFGLAWAAMGLGVITTGPVAVIVPLLIITAFGLISGTKLRPFFSLRAWPWLLVTSLPWFVAVSLRRPDFPAYALFYEPLEHVATKTAGRTGPIWYFVPVLLAGSFPWIGPAIAAAVRGWQRRSRRRDDAGRGAVFVAAWALVPLVFFSLSPSKLPGHYLPALPAVALAAALLLAVALRDEGARHQAVIGTTVSGVLLAALAVALVVFSAPISQLITMTPFARNALSGLVFGLGVPLATAAAVTLIGARRRSVWLVAAGLAIPSAATPFGAGRFVTAVTRDRSSRELAASIDAAAPRARVVGVEAYPTSLRYYLDRPVLLSSASAAELTSNYVTSRAAEFRGLPGSPLREAGWWREAITACTEPTVLVVRRGLPSADSVARLLPLIAAGGADAKFIAYGPCRPLSPVPLSPEP